MLGPAIMPRLTLIRVFVISLVGLLVGLGGLSWIVISELKTMLFNSADESRARNSAIVGASVSNYLKQAPGAAAHFESLMAAGCTRLSDIRSVRDGLLNILLENNAISEATFTFGKRTGFDASGNAIIDPATAGQETLFRAQVEASAASCTAGTWYEERAVLLDAHPSLPEWLGENGGTEKRRARPDLASHVQDAGAQAIRGPGALERPPFLRAWTTRSRR